MAGESAQEIARKRRDKAERLNRVADAYERGADGERQTAQALAMLPASDWFVLHDVRWPGKRFANIDHVVIGAGGVFIIDSKAWSGVVEVRDGVLRQNGHTREPAVLAAVDAAVAVAEQVSGLDPRAAQPVLCFVGDHQLEDWVRDVMLCTPANLVAMLRSRPQVLDDRAVRRTLLALQQALKAAASAPEPTPRRTPARSGRVPRTSTSRRSGSARRLLSAIGLLGLGLAALLVVPRLAPDIGRALAPHVIPGDHSALDGHELGSRQFFPAGTHRPPLRVTADHAITAHRVGTLPYLVDGNRFFAVRLSLTNVGKRTWVSQPGTAAQAFDSFNVPHANQGMMRIREGRVLPDTLRIPPGRTMRGYVVFQLSRTTSVTGLSLTVGPGTPHTVTWRIDRQ